MTMNKFLKSSLQLFICAVIFLFSSCGENSRLQDKINETTTKSLSESKTNLISDVTVPEEDKEEFRGVWITYSEISSLYRSNSDEYYNELLSVFSFLKDKGFNNIFFHARAFGDAFYSSSYFPWSSYLTGTEGEAPPYDPLAVAVKAAHSFGLKIHAWINPYRISYKTDIDLLSDANPAKEMYYGNRQNNLMITESGIYYSPDSTEVQKLIIDGIKEIVMNYDVDGIHLDDYFYPRDVSSSDSERYKAYSANGGTLTLEDWRRANVNTLVSGIYSAVKTAKPDVLFGISPGGIDRLNYDTYYADVGHWIKNKGYCDYIIPQIYFGFLHKTDNYNKLLHYWSELCDSKDIKLYIGLGMYKCGKTDSYAGSVIAENEWIDNSDIISRQITALRQERKPDGFVIFSLGDLTAQTDNSNKNSEREGLFKTILR